MPPIEMRQTLMLVSCSAPWLAAAWAGPDCAALQQQQQALLQRAHQAEVQLVQAERRRICPQQEALAEQLQAGSLGSHAEAQLNFGAYSSCRQQAEVALQRRRPVLYRNARGLPHYTPEGARLAREAAALSAGTTSCRALNAGATGSDPRP
jgi:hypothetical protein